MSKLIMPEGLSEEEQGNWYFDNQEELAAEYLASRASQHPRRGVAARMFGLPTLLDVPGEDAKLAFTQADELGMDFRAYITRVLHEALVEREHRKVS